MTEQRSSGSKPKLRSVKLGSRPIINAALPDVMGPGVEGLQVALKRVLQHQPVNLEELVEGSNCFVGPFLPLVVAQGPHSWRRISSLYAAKLERHGEPHWAAAHLLAIGRVEEAVQVYRRAGLLAEAVLVASTWLVANDALLHAVRCEYAALLDSSKQLEVACAQWLLAGQPIKAVTAMGSRGTHSALIAASQVALQVTRNGAVDMTAGGQSMCTKAIASLINHSPLHNLLLNPQLLPPALPLATKLQSREQAGRDMAADVGDHLHKPQTNNHPPLHNLLLNSQLPAQATTPMQQQQAPDATDRHVLGLPLPPACTQSPLLLLHHWGGAWAATLHCIVLLLPQLLAMSLEEAQAVTGDGRSWRSGQQQQAGHGGKEKGPDCSSFPPTPQLQHRLCQLLDRCWLASCQLCCCNEAMALAANISTFLSTPFPTQPDQCPAIPAQAHEHDGPFPPQPKQHASPISTQPDQHTASTSAQPSFQAPAPSDTTAAVPTLTMGSTLYATTSSHSPTQTTRLTTKAHGRSGVAHGIFELLPESLPAEVPELRHESTHGSVHESLPESAPASGQEPLLVLTHLVSTTVDSAPTGNASSIESHPRLSLEDAVGGTESMPYQHQYPASAANSKKLAAVVSAASVPAVLHPSSAEPACEDAPHSNISSTRTPLDQDCAFSALSDITDSGPAVSAASDITDAGPAVSTTSDIADTARAVGAPSDIAHSITAISTPSDITCAAPAISTTSDIAGTAPAISTFSDIAGTALVSTPSDLASTAPLCCAAKGANLSVEPKEEPVYNGTAPSSIAGSGISCSTIMASASSIADPAPVNSTFSSIANDAPSSPVRNLKQGGNENSAGHVADHVCGYMSATPSKAARGADKGLNNQHETLMEILQTLDTLRNLFNKQLHIQGVILGGHIHGGIDGVTAPSIEREGMPANAGRSKEGRAPGVGQAGEQAPPAHVFDKKESDRSVDASLRRVVLVSDTRALSAALSSKWSLSCWEMGPGYWPGHGPATAPDNHEHLHTDGSMPGNPDHSLGGVDHSSQVSGGTFQLRYDRPGKDQLVAWAVAGVMHVSMLMVTGLAMCQHAHEKHEQGARYDEQKRHANREKQEQHQGHPAGEHREPGNVPTSSSSMKGPGMLVPSQVMPSWQECWGKSVQCLRTLVCHMSSYHHMITPAAGNPSIAQGPSPSGAKPGTRLKDPFLQAQTAHTQENQRVLGDCVDIRHFPISSSLSSGKDTDTGSRSFHSAVPEGGVATGSTVTSGSSTGYTSTGRGVITYSVELLVSLQPEHCPIPAGAVVPNQLKPSGEGRRGTGGEGKWGSSTWKQGNRGGPPSS